MGALSRQGREIPGYPQEKWQNAKRFCTTVENGNPPFAAGNNPVRIWCQPFKKSGTLLTRTVLSHRTQREPGKQNGYKLQGH